MHTPPKITEDQLSTPIYFDECGLEDLEYDTLETAAFFTLMADQIKEFGQNSNYPVGAVYFGIDENNRNFFLPCVNTIPDEIGNILPEGEESLEGSHMTAHAELVGMMKLPAFQHLSVACHVPFCPTCMEAISELANADHQEGLFDNFYFDAASLEDPESLSKYKASGNMPRKISSRGQIGLHTLHIETNDDDTHILNVEMDEITPHIPAHERKLDNIENPVQIRELRKIKSYDDITPEMLTRLRKHTEDYAKISTIPGNEEAVTIITKNSDGKFYAITAAASLPPGFKSSLSSSFLEQDETRLKKSYKYKEDALKRAKVATKTADISTFGAMMICTQTPTAGMLVNAKQYGIETIVTSDSFKIDLKKPRDRLLAKFITNGVFKHITASHKTTSAKKAKKNGHQPAAAPHNPDLACD